MPVVVLDVGSAFARACHCGEAAPRAAARSPPALRRALRAAGGGCDNAGGVIGDGILAEQLAACLSPLLVRGLLLRGAGEARVVLVEPALWPERVRAAACAALLEQLGVAQLRLVPHALACAAACARATALVVDCGADECRVVPVVLGAALPESRGDTTPPPAAAAVSACATALLVAALVRAVALAAPQSPAAKLAPAHAAPGLLSVRPGAAAGGGSAFGLDLVAVGAEAACSERIDDGGGDGGGGEDSGYSVFGGEPLRPVAAASADSLEAVIAQWVESSIFLRGAVSPFGGPPAQQQLQLQLSVPNALARSLGLRLPGLVAVPAAAWWRCFDVPFDAAAASTVANLARELLQPVEAAVPLPPHFALLQARAFGALDAVAASDFTPLHLAVADALRLAPIDARRQTPGSRG